MTRSPDCNVKANYFQSPAYWDTPYEAPSCYRGTASENTRVDLLHCGPQRSWILLAEAWWAGISPELQDSFFCCYLQKCLWSEPLAVCAQCHWRLHLLWLQNSMLAALLSAERLWHPQRTIRLVWRWRLKRLQEAFLSLWLPQTGLSSRVRKGAGNAPRRGRVLPGFSVSSQWVGWNMSCPSAGRAALNGRKTWLESVLCCGFQN